MLVIIVVLFHIGLFADLRCAFAMAFMFSGAGTLNFESPNVAIFGCGMTGLCCHRFGVFQTVRVATSCGAAL